MFRVRNKDYYYYYNAYWRIGIAINVAIYYASIFSILLCTLLSYRPFLHVFLLNFKLLYLFKCVFRYICV